MILYAVLGVVLATFLLVVVRGAPYVPTHSGPAKHAFDMLDMPGGGTIVDLGSGDGVVLKYAAMRGYHAIGYELNPFLCLISYLRCWRYRHLVSIRWRDFWLSPLPGNVDAVFVFLSGPYLHRLDRKLSKERPKNPDKPLMVVSYGFLIPGKGKPIKTEQALHLYRY